MISDLQKIFGTDKRNVKILYNYILWCVILIHFGAPQKRSVKPSRKGWDGQNKSVPYRLDA